MDQFSLYRDVREDLVDSSVQGSDEGQAIDEYEIVLNGETFLDDEEDYLLPTIEEAEEEEASIAAASEINSSSRSNLISSRMLALIRIRDIGKNIDFQAI